MTSYKIEFVTFDKLGGISLPIVMTDGTVDLFAASYALQRYESGKRVNTIKQDQAAILHLYRYSDESGLDVRSRLKTLTPMVIGQIESFSSSCMCNPVTGELYSPVWFTSRMNGALSFMEHVWRFYQGLTKDPAIVQQSEEAIGRMQKAFRMLLKKPYIGSKADKVGLTPELRERFIRIINPDASNDQNPWKGEKIRWRNYVLLLILMVSGNRKGETLLLKTNNLQLTGRRKYIDIERRVDVTDYPRQDQPSVKTYGKQVDISDEFARIIEYYITEIRKQFTDWNKSSYLFLSYRDGKAISLRTPNAILETLIEKHPEFDGKLSPHRLRNTFHDLLNSALNEKFKNESPLSRSLSKRVVQEEAGGWARNSTMPERYAQGDIRRTVAEIQTRVQSELLNISSMKNGG